MQAKARVREAVAFLRGGIWRIRARTLPPRKFFLIRLARIILLAVRGFHTDKCALRASALTFFSVLSIVPAFAMVFGVAKGFGMDKVLEDYVRTGLANQEEVAQRILDFSRSLLEKAQGGVMAGAGLIIVLWTVIKVLGHVEKSFNEIWGVKEQRTLMRRFTDYLSLVIICPIFVIVSGGATVLVTAKIEALLNAVSLLGILAPLVIPVLRLLPYVVGWALFAFVYTFMPNTKVNLRSAIVAGVVAGTLYQLVQWAYFAFQIGVTKYSAIYGSFAVLPLFLIWLQVTWLVVLFGCELAFAHQNVETYEFEPDCLLASRAFKRLVALRITQFLVRNFDQALPPSTARQVSHELGAPIRLVNEVLFDLVRAGILSETRMEAERDIGYQPARSICSLTLAQVTEALDFSGTADIPLLESDQLQKISASLDDFRQAVRQSPANILVKDI
jgi:membrane protein